MGQGWRRFSIKNSTTLILLTLAHTRLSTHIRIRPDKRTHRQLFFRLSQFLLYLSLYLFIRLYVYFCLSFDFHRSNPNDPSIRSLVHSFLYLSTLYVNSSINNMYQTLDLTRFCFSLLPSSIFAYVFLHVSKIITYCLLL